jgi:hypothetical protein
MNDGGPAFPHNVLDHGHGVASQLRPGMSLRDWFAGQVAVECLKRSTTITEEHKGGGVSKRHDVDADGAARAAYKFADALLAAKDAG